MTRLEVLPAAELRQLEVRWGAHPSAFGPCVIATCPRGVCWLAFVGAKQRAEVLAELRRQLRCAMIREDARATVEAARAAFGSSGREQGLAVSGTPFQVAVWRALLLIPAGTTTSYGALARAVGRPKAARAVGQAVGANPISLLIPCHRVVRKGSRLEGYRWGVEVKRALLESEAKASQRGADDLNASSLAHRQSAISNQRSAGKKKCHSAGD